MIDKLLDTTTNLQCTCGFVFDLMRPWESYAHYVIQQRSIQEYLRLQAEKQDDIGEENISGYYEQLDKLQEQSKLFGHIYECPECGRIIWLRQGQNPLSEVLTDYSEYVPQTDRTRKAYDSDKENPKGKYT